MPDCHLHSPTFRSGSSLPFSNATGMVRSNDYKFVIFVSIRKESNTIRSVRVLFYAVDVFLSRKSGSYMCKKSAKTDKAKIREILAPHLLQRGPNRVKSYSSLSGLIN